MLTTHLLLVRHGQTADNVSGQLAGQHNSEMTAEGVRQARQLAEYLACNFQVDAIYTSPLQRALLTATLLGEKLGPSPIITDDLVEIDLGEAVGTDRQILVKPADVAEPIAPGGESAQAFQTRVWGAMNKIVQDNAGRTVIIVSHGGALGVFLAQAAGEGPRAWMNYLMDNCALTEVDAQADHYQMRRFGVLPAAPTFTPFSLGELLDSQRNVLIGRMAAELRCVGGKEYDVPSDQLEMRLARTFEAFYQSIVEDDPHPLTLFIEKIVRQRTLEGLSHHGIQLVADAIRSVLLEAVDEACYDSPKRWLGYTRKVEDLVHLSRIAITDVYAATRDETFANQQKELLDTYQQVKQRADEMSVLSSINLAISSSVELDDVLRRIIESALRLLRAEVGSIYVLDKMTGEYVQRGIFRGEYRRETVPPPRPDGHTSLIMSAGQPLIIPDTQLDSSVSESTLKHGIRATIGIPIRVEDENIGVFYVHSLSPRPFTDRDLSLLGALAHQSAVAIKNAQLFINLKKRTLQLQAAAEVSRAASSILDLDKLLPQAVELIRNYFDLYYVGLFLADDAGKWASLRAGTGEAGRRMLEARHKLEVGGASMIGWCVANAQARIALDVGQDAVRFDNPLLPATRSELALPLVSRGRVIGAMTVQSAQRAAFSGEDIITLQAMTDQVSNTIENARLFHERQRRITELSILNEIGQTFSSALDLDELMETVHQQVGRIFDVTNFYIVTYEEKADEWASVLHLEHGQRYPSARRKVGRKDEAGMTGYIIRGRQPLFLRDSQAYTAFHEKQGVEFIGELAKCFLGVPLIAAGKVVGVMAIYNYERENLYTEQDVALFSTIAAQAAIAIQNARLFAEERQRREQLRLINEVGRQISSIMEAEELIWRVATLIREAFDYYYVSLSLVEGDDLVVRAPVGGTGGQAGAVRGARLQVGRQGITGWVASSGQPIIVPDVSAEPRYYAAPELADSRSMIAVPLKTRDEVIGVLSIEESRANAFDEDMLALLQVLADQIAIAIGNARLYETAQRAEREARQANQMKSRFLATMSHELRTPLNSIINFTAFVMKGMFGPVNDEQASYLVRVVAQGKHLLSIINDVLDLSKIEAGQMKLQLADVSPAMVCREALDAVAGLAQEKKQVLDNQASGDLTVQADRIRLRQVLLNLLSNAVKFTPPNGRITVRAESVSAPPALALAAPHAVRAPCLLISVADTGVGISPDQIEAIFDEFHQTEAGRREGGTGLGLTISRRIVAMHGGHLWVESEIGSGSTFYFTLPLTSPTEETHE